MQTPVFERSSNNRTLYEFCQHSLMHLYLQIAETSRFTTTEKRNDIIKKFIKSRIKSPQCKSIKNDLKRILTVSKKGNLERCINNLLNELLIPVAKEKTINLAVNLLAEIHEKTHLDVFISERSDIAQENACYMLKDQLFNRIGSDGKVLEPLSLLVYCVDDAKVIDVINQSGSFIAEQVYKSEDGNQGHILLKPAH